MWRRKLVQKKQVLTYADFVDAREADVEDVIGTAFYLELVNAEYAAALGEPVAEKDLKSKHPRITVRLEEHFAENPLRDCKERTACTVDRRVVRCARGVGYPAGKACSAGARAHGAIAPGVGGD